MKLFAMLAALLFVQSASAKAVNYLELVNRFKTITTGKTQPPDAQVMGTINGGGASGLECTRLDGTKTVRLLDMKELFDLWGLQEIQLPNGTDAEAMDLLAGKITDHYWNPWTIEKAEMKKLIADLFSDFLQGAKFLKPGQDLNPVDDVHTPIFDPNCKSVQIAMLYNESQFLIDTDLWNQLPAIDRAALLGHELAYLQARLNGEADSINARKFISHLFSTRGLRPRADGAPVDFSAIVSCYSNTEDAMFKVSSFGYEFTSPYGIQETKLIFVSLDGKDPLFRSEVDMPFAIDALKNGMGGYFAAASLLTVETFPWQRNEIKIAGKQKPSGGVDLELSYFNQNGNLVGGPWPLWCN